MTLFELELATGLFLGDFASQSHTCADLTKPAHKPQTEGTAVMLQRIIDRISRSVNLIAEFAAKPTKPSLKANNLIYLWGIISLFDYAAKPMRNCRETQRNPRWFRMVLSGFRAKF